MTQQETGAGVLAHGQGHTHLAHAWAWLEPTRWDPGTWGGPAPLPSASLSLPSPAVASAEEAEPWHRCCATPVSAPVEGRCGAGHWATRIYAWANLACGLSSPCHIREHLYPTTAIGIGLGSA